MNDFTGKYISSCCDELMDYNQGLCQSCYEPCEAIPDFFEPEKTPEELLEILNKARSEMKEMGL